MRIRLVPNPPHPEVLFSIVFDDLREPLPSPISWVNQFNSLVAENLELPALHHSLDKAACLPSLLEDVSFNLNTLTISCTFVDGAMEEWPLMDMACLQALQGVISDVNSSAREAEREREREQQERLERQTPPPSPTKQKGHKKQRSLLMTLVSQVFNLSSSRSSSPPSTPPPRVAPLPPVSPSATVALLSPRFLRRRARSTLVDSFRRYVVPELAPRLNSGGYYGWIVQSTFRRASARMEEIAGQQSEPFSLAVQTRGPWDAPSSGFYYQSTPLPSPPPLCEDDDSEDTDTDGSSVHTPTSSHFNTISSAYQLHASSASSSAPSPSRPNTAHASVPYEPCMTHRDLAEYTTLSTMTTHLRQLLMYSQEHAAHMENEKKSFEAVLEIRGRRRAWLNKTLVGGPRGGIMDVGLAMPFRSSPLSRCSWSSDDYELVPDYEERLAAGVRRLRLSDGPRLFPVAEESEEELCMAKELGLDEGLALEEGRAVWTGEDASECGLQVELDLPQVRPRIRTSSMRIHRRRWLDPQIPPCPDVNEVPPPLRLVTPPIPPLPQLPTSSLLCQPLAKPPPIAMGLDGELEYGMGVGPDGALDYNSSSAAEFTLSMDLPIRARVQGRRKAGGSWGRRPSLDQAFTVDIC
ncbi:hypothetical protein HGRIS_012542 [Hohenbuehelia grisea]|uniref:Uncharacterized protein n=1 Tax=Hohenbuehelia grisea TaxID=104357 RepID=A0ABR3ISM4_9AGAR